MIRIENLSKTFTLHNQGAAAIPVMTGGTLSVARGECVGLVGPSGTGKSTLMRMVYGNYLADGGSIQIGTLDVARAEPREIIALRRQTLVLCLIEEAKARGAAILGIFHDETARARVCDRLVDVAAFTPPAAA